MPNPSLMGNHQQGLADELSRSRYLFTCSAGDLARTIASYAPARLRPYEGGDPKAAARAVQGAVWEQDASPRPQPAVSPVTGFEIIIVIALSVLLSSLWVWVNNTKGARSPRAQRSGAPGPGRDVLRQPVTPQISRGAGTSCDCARERGLTVSPGAGRHQRPSSASSTPQMRSEEEGRRKAGANDRMTQ